MRSMSLMRSYYLWVGCTFSRSSVLEWTGLLPPQMDSPRTELLPNLDEGGPELDQALAQPHSQLLLA